MGLGKSGKGEEVACLDQALYFASSTPIFFAVDFDWEAELKVVFVSVWSLSSDLTRGLAPRRWAVVVLWGFATLLFVTLAAAERVDLVIMIVVGFMLAVHQSIYLYCVLGY